MQYLIRKYFSGFCTSEIEANSEDEAFEKTSELPNNYDEVMSNLEDWSDANEIEQIEDN